MILGSQEIHNRLLKGQIFRPTTWEIDSIKEASYALRVADDGLIVDGKVYPPGKPYPHPRIEIKPGSIAILSTVERLCIPGDLVGRLGIRLDFASLGLTGLMGIQVDPYYGQNYQNERLYIKVANFGNESVEVYPNDLVFNIEFSEVKGLVFPNSSKKPTWDRLIEKLVNQEHSDWTYVTRVQSDMEDRAQKLEQDTEKQVSRGIEGVRDNQQSVVMFGVFLVSITILGVMVGLILSVRDAPNWVTQGGWIALFMLFFIAAGAIVGFVFVAGVVLWKTRIRSEAKSG